MTVTEALISARETLAANNIEDAALESELLLRHVLDISRVQLYLDSNRQITLEQETALRQLIARRLNHEPTAYITAHCEFFGLDFYIDNRALIPRPETELIVTTALKMARQHPNGETGDYLIADVGTGSGIIAVTLARHLPLARIYASDISAAALEVAATNCQRHGVQNRVRLLQGDLLASLPESVDLIAANLPYVTTGETQELSPEIRLFEPRIALDGGADGLEKIRQLALQLSHKLKPRGSLLLEVGRGQGSAVTGFLLAHLPSAAIKLIPDYSGIDRVVALTLPAQPQASAQLAYSAFEVDTQPPR